MDPHRAGRVGQADLRPLGDDVELDQEVAEGDLRRRLVDHDAHGAVGRMGADVDDCAREAAVLHSRHRDQELTVEIAALRGLVRDALYHGESLAWRGQKESIGR